MTSEPTVCVRPQKPFRELSEDEWEALEDEMIKTIMKVQITTLVMLGAKFERHLKIVENK